MKPNVRRGGGFRGLLEYALDRGDACEIVGGNLEGRTPKALAAEFGVARNLRPDCARPVWHCSLSLPAGEHLDNEKWHSIAQGLMTKVGMDPNRHQFVAVIHRDTQHEHVHVIGSRISLDGKLWHGVDDAFTAQLASQDLEIEHGLTITKGPEVDKERPGKGLRASLKLSQAEREMWSSRGILPPKVEIAAAIDQAIKLSDGSPADFKRHLELTGVDARLSVGKGKITGGSYSVMAAWEGGEELCSYKGGDIGRLYEAKEIDGRLTARRAEIEHQALALDRLANLQAEKAIENHPANISKLAEATASLREVSIDVGSPGLRERALADARSTEWRGPQKPAEGRSPDGADLGDARGGPEASGLDRAERGPGSLENRPDFGSDGDHRQPAESFERGPGSHVLAPARALQSDGHPDPDEAENLTDHSLPASPSLPPEGVGSIEPGGVAAIAPSEPRQAFKVSILAQNYRHALDADEFKEHLHWVRPGLPGGPIQVALYGGQRITDDGKTISLSRGQADDVAVKAMLGMAEANGWKSVTLTGSDDFKNRAWLEAQRRGVAVSGYEPPDHVRRQWQEEEHEREVSRLARAGTGEGSVSAWEDNRSGGPSRAAARDGTPGPDDGELSRNTLPARGIGREIGRIPATEPGAGARADAFPEGQPGSPADAPSPTSGRDRVPVPGGRAGFEGGNRPTEIGAQQPAGFPGEGSGSDHQYGRASGSSAGASAEQPRGPARGVQVELPDPHAAELEEVGQWDKLVRQPSENIQPDTEGNKKPAGRGEGRDGRNGEAGGLNRSTDQASQGGPMASDGSDPLNGDRRRGLDSGGDGMAWNSRFKRASAAKKREGEGLGQPVSGQSNVGSDARFLPRSVGKEVIDRIKNDSPLEFLRKNYGGENIEINKSQTSIRINGVLRADLSRDGHWVSCDWGGDAIGDNIALAQWVKPDMNFPDTVYELSGARPDITTRVSPKNERRVEDKRPHIPFEKGRSEGRKYLTARGISEEIIDVAERAGALRYLENAVMFTGRDETKAIRSATLRHIKAVSLEDGTIITKRDLADSNKNFPAVIPGSKKTVVIVEGGINALAVQDLAARAGHEIPTVIATGGVGVRKFVEVNPEVRALLEAAEKVQIMAENEMKDGKPDPEKQAKTDLFREKLASAVAEVRQGELPQMLKPPIGSKDAADWNAKQVADLAKRLAERLAEEERLERIRQNQVPTYRPRM